MTTKVISSIIMIIVLIPIVILGGLPYNLLALLIALGGFYELIKLRERKKEIPFIVKIIAYIITTILIFNNTNEMGFSYALDYRILALVIISMLGPIVFLEKDKNYNIQDALYLISSILFIGISFNLLILLRNYGLNYFLYIIVIANITDTFCFFSGSCIGRHKLAPKISPNKTIEGSVGGSIAGTIISTIYYLTFVDPLANVYFIIFVTLILTIFAQVGDLVFSAIKRYYDTKDFSNLIPGHGGILDRFDSIIFVVLVFIIIIGLL
ncbi:MAG: phosphatidate cytidylyltransferase [Tenericutes bacterium]|nr:phosphatidate cytidylyltransferase [Mycoplasmatota bacterium]